MSARSARARRSEREDAAPVPSPEPHAPASPLLRLALPLVFGSGFCALAYQVGWQREFRLIFGASTAASAAVVAVFMFGLGLGGAVVGPRIDRHRRSGGAARR